MSDQGTQQRTSVKPTILRGNLVRTAAARLFLISLLPVLLFSLIVYLLTDQSLRPSILPLMLTLLAALIVVLLIVSYFVARKMLAPLDELTRIAKSFASGEWSARARTDRKDELEQLALEFNQLAEELSGFNRSLEEKVEERIKNQNLITEIVQTVRSASNQTELLRAASQLIHEKFGYPYNAVYEVNHESKTIKRIHSAPQHEGELQIPFGDHSLVGCVAASKQPRLVENFQSETDLSDKTGLAASMISALAIPILLGNQVIGIIDLQSDQEGTFTSSTVSIFTALSEQLSDSLQSVLTFESTQVDLRENIALNRYSRQISNAQTTEEVNQSLTALFSHTGFISAFFSVRENQIELLNFTDPKNVQSNPSAQSISLPFQKGLQRLQDEGVAIIDNLEKQTDYSNLAALFFEKGCRSLGLVPVFSGEQLTYILALGAREDQSVSLLQMQPYGSLAGVIGTTLDRINLLAQLNKRVSELTALSAIGQVAAKSPSPEELFIRLHDQLRKLFGENTGLFIALDVPEKQTINIPYYFDFDETEIAPYPYSDDLATKIIVQQETCLHQDAASEGLHSIHSLQKTLTTKSLLGIPLIIGNKVIGALVLFDSTASNRFSPENLNLLQSLAPQIAAFIQNAELIGMQERALQSYEQEHFLFNSFLKNTPDQIAFIDAQGRYIRMSDSLAAAFQIQDASTLLERGNEQLPSLNNVEAFKDLEIIKSQLPEIDKIEKSDDLEGKEAFSLISRIPLNNEKGETVSLLKMSHDITDLITEQNNALHRSERLLTALQIVREASLDTLDIDETLKRLVDLIRTSYGFYHAAIFLLDSTGEFAVLREATGEAGRMMKLTGYKLAAASSSSIGQAINGAETVIENDLLRTANYSPNPLLPKTRSEAALPLNIGTKVIGALDLYSETENAFSAEEIDILKILAEQLAVTIQNARLFTKTQQTLQHHRTIHKITSTGQSGTIEDAIRNAVQTINLTFPDSKVCFMTQEENGTLRVRAYAGFATADTTTLRIKPGSGIVGIAAKERKPMRVFDAAAEKDMIPLSAESRSILAVPVIYSNNLLGVINIENPSAGAYDEDDQEVISSLANSLASILSNIRLVDQIRLQVERQRQLYDITSKIRRSVDMETIMQTSVSEICNTLNIRRGSIQLNATHNLEENSKTVSSKKESSK